jgi:hypothetical protein
VDALSSDYVDWLKGGEGAAFLGLFAPDVAALKQRLSLQGMSLVRRDGLWMFAGQPALERVFFSRRQHAPTDRPEHFAHANTALRLSGAWFAGAGAERALVRALGAATSASKACGPLGAIEEALALPEAELLFVQEAAQLRPGRSVAGLRISVRDLRAAQRIFDEKSIAYTSSVGCDQQSLWVTPGAAHGVWLEFRQ